MRQFLKVMRFAEGYGLQAVLNVLFNILAILFSLVSLTMLIPFLQLLFYELPEAPESKGDFNSIKGMIDAFNYHFYDVIVDGGKAQALIMLCGVILVVFLMKNLFRYLALYFMATIRNGTVKNMRQAMFDKSTQLSIAYFSNKRKGDILTRMTTDILEIERSIMAVLEITVKEPVTIIFYLGAMLYYSPRLTLFVLVMLGLTVIVVGGIGRQLKRKSKTAMEHQGLLLSLIDEMVSGLRIVKAFNAEEFLRKRFGVENQKYFTINRSVMRRRDLSSPLSEVLVIGILVSILWVGGRMVFNPDNDLKPETFITFMVIFSQMIAPAKAFSSAYYHIQRGLASAERVQQILDADLQIEEKPDALPVKGFERTIEYKNLSFAYEDEPVLKNIDLVIPKGKVLALVGASGAGKSTMADLLPRFYDPQNGAVLLDGQDIREFKLKELRGLMGMVSQEAILFNDTVFNNISFGVEGATKEAVEEAARIANAHDFISRLPDGYQTTIGDRGDKLSGGERQRLTIARAVLHDPEILILDEATSSLDSESEQAVREALQHLMKNRTALVIAHRLSTIQDADEIIVMQAGRIAERGNHADLIAAGGIYKKLVGLQGL